MTISYEAFKVLLEEDCILRDTLRAGEERTGYPTGSGFKFQCALHEWLLFRAGTKFDEYLKRYRAEMFQAKS